MTMSSCSGFLQWLLAISVKGSQGYRKVPLSFLHTYSRAQRQRTVQEVCIALMSSFTVVSAECPTFLILDQRAQALALEAISDGVRGIMKAAKRFVCWYR
jgi:hypothetical protein